MKKNLEWGSKLIEIGIAPHLRAFDYILAIIEVIEEDESRIHSMTKEVYPLVSEKLDCTIGAIERAIRYAIKNTNGKIRKSTKWKNLFRLYPSPKVSVTEFISIFYFSVSASSVILELRDIAKEQREVA